jgi:HD-GYP domain-containing protein (c-di-GMP phosphodiesterase class II)
MLKKISTRELRLGMHLHRLEGAWMDHPFWRARFVINEAADLHKLHACGVAECWIDTDLGSDVADAAVTAPTAALPAQAGEAAAPAAQAAPDATPVPPRMGSVPTQEFGAELREAAAICRRGREAVSNMFAEARLGKALDTEACRALVEEVALSVERNAGALVSLARLKSKDDYSYMHSVAVCALMVALARQLGMDEAQCREAGIAGLMHDVGKALMPLELLGKTGKLSEAEWLVMRTHPERGHALLLEGGTAPPAALDVALHHHERVDGTGYPHRLAGEAISRFARMGAICDVYDAITSNRPYKAGWDPADSIAKMASWKGHFDARLFTAFVHSLGIYPTGSLVRLESGRLAVVAEQSPGALLTPVVVAFFSTRTQMHVPPQRIDLARPGCGDRIVAREGAAAAQFKQMDELWVDPQVLRRIPR